MREGLGRLSEGSRVKRSRCEDATAEQKPLPSRAEPVVPPAAVRLPRQSCRNPAEAKQAVKLSDTSIKRPIFTAMIMMAIVVFGGVMFSRLSVDLFPKVDFPDRHDHRRSIRAPTRRRWRARSPTRSKKPSTA